MADTLKTLISCSAPTTITPPTTRTNPTTSTIPSDEQTSLPEKQTSRPEKSSNGTTTKVPDTPSTTQSTTSKGSDTPTVVTPGEESNVIAWVVLCIVVLLFIVVIGVGFYFYFSKKLKKRAKKRQSIKFELILFKNRANFLIVLQMRKNKIKKMFRKKKRRKGRLRTTPVGTYPKKKGNN